MPRQKKTNPPEVSTEVVKAEAVALVRQSSLTELEAAIDATLLQGEELLRRSDLGRIEFTIDSLQVTNKQEAINANDYLVSLKDGKARFTAYWDSKFSLKRVFHALHGLLCTAQAAGEKRYDTAINRVSELIKAYLRAVQVEEEENQRRLAEATALIKRQQLEDAKNLALEGNMRAAAQLREQARVLTTPVLPKEDVTLAGTYTRPKYIVTIENPAALVKAIADGEVPITAIKEFNVPFLNEQAKLRNVSDGGELYPGVTVKHDQILVRRSA